MENFGQIQDGGDTHLRSIEGCLASCRRRMGVVFMWPQARRGDLLAIKGLLLFVEPKGDHWAFEFV